MSYLSSESPPHVVILPFMAKGIIQQLFQQNDFEPEFAHPEPEFVDYWNRKASPRDWCIGPLCLASEKKVMSKHNNGPMWWIQWLDEMSEMEKPVLYVAFGSLEEITIDQYREIAIGLENSGEHFLWVLRLPSFDNDEFMVEFEERVKERGLLVKNQWVAQVEILSHKCVHGFMSHCGWNSVLIRKYMRSSTNFGVSNNS
ncbi:UDP-glycosyltransferase 90A2-like [Papaver somniferum]|uniref:UDP-glycosyltransferase 90A2-like n=1 Tax=Papaver somniferum TaxID=3469 RepID=UPI000E7047B4|nr:UDP-glycosyltransferase 90A2-like [Papaver somniferum]